MRKSTIPTGSDTLDTAQPKPAPQSADLPTQTHRRPAAIFWDMDGTLTDSEPIWGEATYYMSELLGRRMTPELREKTVGGTFDNAFQIAAQYAGYTPKPGDKEYYQERMFEFMRKAFAKNSVVFPGIRSLLQQLHADGIPMLVTTNTERPVADPVIADIGPEFFFSTICGDEVSAGKPAPDMYLRAAELVGRKPEECLVFEDSFNGMTAAVSAGCVTIGLPAQQDTEIPEGVTPISQLRPSRHLDGATSQDVYQWFSELTKP